MKASVVIYNTCSIRDHAEQKVRRLIMRLHQSVLRLYQGVLAFVPRGVLDTPGLRTR